MNTIRPLDTDECAVINKHLDARREQNIPTTHLEDIRGILYIINRWRDQKIETYMGIPLFRTLPPGSTHDSESPVKPFRRCVEGHGIEVYCSGCCPAGMRVGSEGIAYIPKDEVGTFDIGTDPHEDFKSAFSIQYKVKERIQDTIDEVTRGLVGVDELRESIFSDDVKGPGFEARLKNMEGKAPMSLLSPIFLEGICAALAHGSEKYAPNMWRDDPMTFTAELDSIFRHLFAFLRCEDYDAAPPSGSGLLHLFNAGCRLMFLTERYFTHPELDDRYPAPGLNDEMFQEEVEEKEEPSYNELVVLIKNLNAQLQEFNNV